MNDETTQVNAVTRNVNSRNVDGKLAKTVVLAQTYETEIAELWDAVTNPERIPHWFAPVSGDLRLHGQYQVEGNASGTFTACDAPHGFDATWEFGGGVSWIEVRLTEVDDSHTRLELTHLAHPEEHWDQFGPGAVGIGWDLSFLGLATYIATNSDVPAEATEWGASSEAIAFMTKSGEAWIAADIAGGEDPEDAQRRGGNTISFYTGSSPE